MSGDGVRRPGQDVIDCDNAGAAYIDGGTDNDEIRPTMHLSVSSSKNASVLNENFKNDAGAVNTILGGSGSDTLSGDTNDIIDGGPANQNDVGIVRLFSNKHIS